MFSTVSLVITESQLTFVSTTINLFILWWNIWDIFYAIMANHIYKIIGLVTSQRYIIKTILVYVITINLRHKWRCAVIQLRGEMCLDDRGRVFNWLFTRFLSQRLFSGYLHIRTRTLTTKIRKLSLCVLECFGHLYKETYVKTKSFYWKLLT